MLRYKNMIAAVCFVLLCELSSIFSESFMHIGSNVLWYWNNNSYFFSGIYFYDNDYVISPAPWTSTDYEYDQICRFKKKLDAAGIHLLYVNKPTKYLDDSVFRRFMQENYCNDNADRFLSRIDAGGIDYLDLRDEIKKNNMNIYEMFYRTDHHWTVPAGKWGAEKIAEKLNETCEYNIDTGIYDDRNYEFTTTKEAWYGEQGAKFEGSPLKKDDYTLITPKFETSYLYYGDSFDFSSLFILNPHDCRHYNYQALSCVNQNVDEGKILFLGDSFDMITEPFLSLGVHQIDFLILRNTDETDIYQRFIKDKGYDTVIICYAPFMIGAHDSPDSANYNMFTFEKDIDS